MRDLDRGIQRYINQTANRVPFELAQLYAPWAETEAKTNAPWTDRTGNARQGLRGVPKQIRPGVAHILLTHSVDYGANLETRRQGRYAIILPTMEQLYVKLRTCLEIPVG